MMTQMYSREDASELSRELVQHLKQGIHDTHRQDEWSQRNFALLREFAAKHDAESYPSAQDAPPELKSRAISLGFHRLSTTKGDSACGGIRARQQEEKYP
ncbi:MAG TPA: hypothetical protein VMR02_21075 [Terracidiphilus sp.]|jgi:hypothetical protein|nr:hypothetical protein [Terracidiphilus sp.]